MTSGGAAQSDGGRQSRGHGRPAAAAAAPAAQAPPLPQLLPAAAAAAAATAAMTTEGESGPLPSPKAMLGQSWNSVAKTCRYLVSVQPTMISAWWSVMTVIRLSNRRL